MQVEVEETYLTVEDRIVDEDGLNVADLFAEDGPQLTVPAVDVVVDFGGAAGAQQVPQRAQLQRRTTSHRIELERSVLFCFVCSRLA